MVDIRMGSLKIQTNGSIILRNVRLVFDMYLALGSSSLMP